MKNISSIAALQAELASDTSLQEQFKSDPIAAINSIQPTPLNTDKWIYRMVVFALGFTIVAIVIGIIILMGAGIIKNDTTMPTILTAIGSAAIGALAGLLAPSPGGNS